MEWEGRNVRESEKKEEQKTFTYINVCHAGRNALYRAMSQSMINN